MNWPFRSKSNPGRELARLGAEKREWQRLDEHSKMLAVAQQMRRELGLPEDPRLA